MLDGFSRYNQILVAEEDKYKTSFTNPWVTYAYNQIFFGLKNAVATFQRDMDHEFKDLIRKIMVDYQDDLPFHSRLKHLHLKHLQEFFTRCRLYGISLNLKKFFLQYQKEGYWGT